MAHQGQRKDPHFTKRKDGNLMCLAGLWDSVTYEGQDTPLHSFTIVTTSSNEQLSFLHERMPVILNTHSELTTWLDTSSQKWSPDLTKLLKPFEGELECYPVRKEVGKVGTQNADFLKPVSERKDSLASFFAKQAASSPTKPKAPDLSSPFKPIASDISSPSKPTNLSNVEKTLPLNPDEGDQKAAFKEEDELKPDVKATSSPSKGKGKKRPADNTDEPGDGTKAKPVLVDFEELEGGKVGKKSKPTPKSTPKKGKASPKGKKEAGQRSLFEFM